MKKRFTYLFFLLFITFTVKGQILNNTADWGAAGAGGWTITNNGEVLLADPETSDCFGYDDDVQDSSPGGENDQIITSPVIDLSAAFAGGETTLEFTIPYDYNACCGTTFDAEYWDADAAAWVNICALADSGGSADYKDAVGDAIGNCMLDISGFTGTQQSGFMYRFNYDEPAAGEWAWGFVVCEPTVISSGCTAPEFTATVDDSACPIISIVVNVTSLGSATSVDITESSATDSETGVGLGTYTLTGYAPGDGTITVTVADNADATCNNTSTVDVLAACPEPNDVCSGAIAYPGTIGANGTCPANNVSLDLTAYTDDGDFPSCDGFGNFNAWYTFTATSTAVDFTSGTGLPGLAIYDGCGGTELGCLNNVSGTISGLTIGNTYTMQIWDDTDDTTIDWCLEEPPACPDPSGLAASAITEDGATMSWTTGGGALATTSLFICPDGVTPPDATCTEFTGASSPQAITGLTSCTAYDVFVQEECTGGSITGLVGPTSFGTAGPAPNLTPACGETVSYPSCLDGYAANENVTITVCPDAGGYAGITFTYVDIEANTADCPWDALNISTASGAEGPLCGEPDGDGGVGSGLGAGDCFHSTNPDDCITVTFTSDASVQETGFEFVVSCVTGADLPSDACVAGGTALPVELLSFNGQVMEDVNKLTWATASEENTEWHIIERSIDGKNDWTEVGKTRAAGTTSDIQRYELLDRSPVVNAYYRLKSLDFDLRFQYSKIVHLQRAIGDGNISIYPNPVGKDLNIDFTLVKAEEVSFTITDMAGKQIAFETLEAARGLNNHSIDFNRLNSGVYFITMTSTSGTVTKRVVKN